MFIDTNVLVYAKDLPHHDKQVKAQRWLDYLWQSRSARLSTQVLNEFYVVITSKLKPGMSKAEARVEIADWLTLPPLIIETRHIEAAFRLEDRYGLNYWDALIVAAAESAGCSHLLTEDLQHNQQLGSVLVINPFLVDPESI